MQMFIAHKRVLITGECVPVFGRDLVEAPDDREFESCIDVRAHRARLESLLEFVQVTFSIQSCHAAGSRGGYCLPVDVVGNVACSEHPFDTGGGGITR